MVVGMARPAMAVAAVAHRRRNEVQLAVPHPTLAHGLIGEGAHAANLAAQYGDFQAAFVVEMHVQGRDLEIVVLVLAFGQAPAEIARLVIVNVGQRRHAVRLFVARLRGLAGLRFAQDVAVDEDEVRFAGGPVGDVGECLEVGDDVVVAVVLDEDQSRIIATTFIAAAVASQVKPTEQIETAAGNSAFITEPSGAVTDTRCLAAAFQSISPPQRRPPGWRRRWWAKRWLS